MVNRQCGQPLMQHFRQCLHRDRLHEVIIHTDSNTILFCIIGAVCRQSDDDDGFVIHLVANVLCGIVAIAEGHVAILYEQGQLYCTAWNESQCLP